MGLGLRACLRTSRLNMKPRARIPNPYEAERRAALEEVRAIYRELESRPIQRNCTRLTECCQFKLTGRTPQLTKGETLLAAKAVRGAGRKALPEPPLAGACPLLKQDGKCTIYQDRPFGCRTHFCAAAGGPYDRPQVLDLIRRLEALDTRLGGSGPRALPVALAEELRAMH